VSRKGGNLYRSLLVPLDRSSFAEQALPLVLSGQTDLWQMREAIDQSVLTAVSTYQLFGWA
jgi:hypothetical protein